MTHQALTRPQHNFVVMVRCRALKCFPCPVTTSSEPGLQGKHRTGWQQSQGYRTSIAPADNKSQVYTTSMTLADNRARAIRQACHRPQQRNRHERGVSWSGDEVISEQRLQFSPIEYNASNNELMFKSAKISSLKMNVINISQKIAMNANECVSVRMSSLLHVQSLERGVPVYTAALLWTTRMYQQAQFSTSEPTDIPRKSMQSVCATVFSKLNSS